MLQKVIRDIGILLYDT